METDDSLEGGGGGGSLSEVQEVKRILWGERINDELFLRWSQGFQFSPDEPTALVQNEGGPCAVIAPVQAFLLRAIMRDTALVRESWRKLPSDRVDAYLCEALTEILRQVANSDSTPSETPAGTTTTPADKLKSIQDGQQEKEPSPAVPQAFTPPSTIPPPPNTYCIVFLNEPLARRISTESPQAPPAPAPPISGTEASSINGPLPPHQSPTPTRPSRCDEEIFHHNLRLLRLDNINQVENVIKEKLESFKGFYGVLQFLYSVILTKGVAKLNIEMSEPSELIDPVYGHGGQSMINLFLSGKGVNYVWDNDKDLGGLQLKGIARQCEVGFLTVLEKLRYCEVGSYLKLPKYPVWLLGSETHLTVLFSWDMNLVKPESPAEIARRIFQTFDPEGNNFIQAVLLEDVMRSLGLFADTEYVEIMTKKLDPESLGIILLNDFMDEFYQNERYGGPDTFTVLHYNGLPRSSSTKKVVYNEGHAIILETDVKCLSDDNMLLTCLQTKWPNIDVQWLGGFTPSIN